MYTRLIVASLMLLPIAAGAAASGATENVVDPQVWQLLDDRDAPIKVWVYFTDKGQDSAAAECTALDAVAEGYNGRSVQRRLLRRTAPGLFDARDLPVPAEYAAAVEGTGAVVRVQSRWLNAVSAVATREQVRRVSVLPFVRAVEPVRRSVPNGVIPTTDVTPAQRPSVAGGFYGFAQGQLDQINLPAVHSAGYTGSSVVVGVLDTGFERTHEAYNYPGHVLNVIAEYDFVDDDGDASMEPGDPADQHYHGTLILGTIGAYNPNVLVGGAYDASFILAKTEDITQEVPAEEDQYVAGLEFIEANGGDMATSSLGYIDWYTWYDLDGLTAVTTVAVNAATDNGLVCVTAAGNGGQDQDLPSLIAPSDAFKVITCGAVYPSGDATDFSSNGPTADNRVKPEVLARGWETYTVDAFDDNGYVWAAGTSLSTPLVACAVALLIDAHPDWTVDHIRTALTETASDYVQNGTYDPAYIRGYGVINTFDAYSMLLGGGDFDQDDDLDLLDVASLQNCFAGEGVDISAAPGCRIGDFDGDDDVDLADYAGFYGAW